MEEVNDQQTWLEPPSDAIKQAVGTVFKREANLSLKDSLYGTKSFPASL